MVVLLEVMEVRDLWLFALNLISSELDRVGRMLSVVAVIVEIHAA